ncbi:chromate efflux transporter [bacterium]|nr:chromate efflux transporter [bacterium]
MAAEDEASTIVAETPDAGRKTTRLGELAALFFRLGTTAFGGPAAHIAMMEDEVVGRRGWVTREAFLDMIGACNLIPGPNSTEMAIHIGHRRAGLAGSFVAGGAFIIPAATITVALAWAYVRFGAMPQVGGALYGVKPVIIAIIAQALWRLGRTAARTRVFAALTAASAAAAFAGLNEIALLLIAGIAAIGLHRIAHRRRTAGDGVLAAIGATPALAASGAGAGVAAVAAPYSLSALFLVFAKIGAVLFGSGYVLLAFLQAELVVRRHWLTQGQLLDAVAVGQFTPGPLSCTATFIGYLLGRGGGAAVATAGIFAPAFFFVAVSGPLLPRIRRSPTAGSFLDGVNAASLALMIVVTWQLGRAAIVDLPTIVIAALSAFLLIGYRINSVWLILAGGLAGAALTGTHF